MPSQVVLELEKRAKEYKTRKVLVQLPEGLKPKSRLILQELRERGFEPVLSASPCFGACDLKFIDNAITLHIGHSKMLDLEPVVYWEYRYNLDPRPSIEKHLPDIKEKKLGLVTTVQHIGFLEDVKGLLEKNGKEVFLGKPGPRCKYPGQVLGCDVGSALEINSKVQAFLFFGSGVFHPQLVSFKTRKRVYTIDPFTGKMEIVGWERFEKEKSLRISKALDSRSFGVVLSTKPGQYFPGVAREILDKARKNGLEAYEIVLENLSPEKLDYLGFDGFVITACPRIVIDDWKNYKKPVLLPDEFYDLLEMRAGN